MKKHLAILSLGAALSLTVIGAYGAVWFLEKQADEAVPMPIEGQVAHRRTLLHSPKKYQQPILILPDGSTHQVGLKTGAVD